jgi:ABC-type glutathione transport system ATPase component
VALLEFDGFGVTYPGQSAPALDDIRLRLDPGELLGLAGESGSGKTTLAAAVLRLLPPGTRTTGRILLDGQDVTLMTWGRLRAMRWAAASIVFQGALHSLDPMRTVAAQLAAPVRLHTGASRHAARGRADDLLRQVGLDPALAGRYAHELSGGQRQRVLTAMALACEPRLVIADEPTTALDVHARESMLALLQQLVRAREMALILIGHDLRLLAGSCDRLAVLQSGRVVEEGPANRFLRVPRHEHVRRLVAATASFGDPAWRRPLPRPLPPDRADSVEPLLRVRGLTVRPPMRPSGGLAPGPASVLEAVDLDLAAGEVLAVIGEVGAGKTTLARAIVGLVRPPVGEIRHAGVPMDRGPAELARIRRWVQYVPQEPTAALDPRHTVRQAVGEGLRIHRIPRSEVDGRVAEVLAEVGLPPGRFLDRRPHELSAGQQQRVVLAAALVLRPRLLVADEPVASLDAAARGEVLDLLLRRAAATPDGVAPGMATLLVTHDLTAAWQVADRVAVVHQGRVVEQGPAVPVLTAPSHPYTLALLRAGATGRDAAGRPFTPE